MKKIVCTIMAAAALAACTKSEVAYEAPAEIGFNVVAGNITKAPVDGQVYPTGLNMYVNAYTTTIAADKTTPDYIYKGEFSHRTDKVNETDVWGGATQSYYWPNEQKLHFSGFSKSGNVQALLENSVSYNPNTDVLTITGYTPGTDKGEGVNDLMWFQSTKNTTEGADGYGNKTPFVPVEMYHTCAWITFVVQGDATTGSADSKYKITSLTMNGVDQTANVTCTGNTSLSASNLSTCVVWNENITQTGDNTTISVTVPTNGVSLAGTYTAATNDASETNTPKNVETGLSDNATTGGNIVVIPQKPGTIDLAWTYSSSTNASIPDSATGLSLKLNDDNTLNWEPGKHYIYTITIKANEILIAPTPVDWDDTNRNVTVE